MKKGNKKKRGEAKKRDELESKGVPDSTNEDLIDCSPPHPFTTLPPKRIRRRIVLEAFKDSNAEVSEKWIDHGNAQIRMIPIITEDLLKRFHDVELNRTTVL